jgi:uncharacterized membrane protein YfcA
MLELLAYPVAALLGFLAGLGVGGGSILMLWLTLVTGMEYTDARTINLLFFLPSAFICTLFRRKQNAVPFRKILPAILCGCVAAAVGSFIGKAVSIDLLKKCFGGLLLFTGLRELFYRPRNAK